MKLKLFFALACTVGLFISIANLYGWTFQLNQVTSGGLDWTTVIDPKHHSTVYIVLGVILMVSSGILWMESNFSFTGGLLCAVAIISLFSGIGRHHLYDPAGPIWIEGLLALLYLTLIALTVNLKLPNKAASTGIFLLLLLPLNGNAQSFGTAKLDLFGNSQAAYGIRPSGYLFAPLEKSTFVATGETLILFNEEPNLSEALFTCGNLWSIQSTELGFLVGVFLEPTEVSEHENGYEGPVRGGPGVMLVYSNSEEKQFRIHTETGVGYNFHDFVALYDACLWYQVNDWSLGARAHYSFGIGATLGYQLPKDFQLNVAGYWDLNNRESDYPIGMTVGIAYHIGENHH